MSCLEKDSQNQINSQIETNSDTKLLSDNKINIEQKINSLSIIQSIFYFNKNAILQFSFPKINKENFNKIIDIFDKGIIPNFENKEDLFSYINDKINIIKELKRIIQNRYEILFIINKLFKKHNFSILEFYINLYFKLLEVLHSDNTKLDVIDENLFLNNEMVKKIIDIINYIISTGLIEKKNYDYIYQKLAALQLSKKLNKSIFYEYLNLLEIFYGKNYDTKSKKNLIAKNYIYFYDKKYSGIETNFHNNKNGVKINNGVSFILWFYLTDIKHEEESILVEIIINDNFPFEIILDIQGDIIVKCQGILLKNGDNINFKIPKFTWVQLKIQMTEKQFKLNIYKDDNKSLNENNTNSSCYGKKNNFRYEQKIYLIEDSPNNNLAIKKINFFKNFLGLVGTLIFCTNENLNEKPIQYRYGLKNNKIYSFLSDSPIFGNYFIFSPSLFVNDKNIFIDSTNNVSGKINNDINNIEFNGVYKYINFTKNIYSLGGIENILPLFEIFYKFTYQKINKKEEDFLYLIFKKLIKILEIILINKKNYLEALYITNSSQNNIFLQSLQLFLEMIDDKYFQKDNEILYSLLNIGKHIYLNFFNPIKIENSYYFFYYVLFSQNIICKYSLAQQEILWKFFDQNNNTKFIINISDFKKCFMPFEQLIKFLISLSNMKDKLEKELPLLPISLINIIKVIFHDKLTKDGERECLLSLCNYENLNINIIEGIIIIYISYLDLNDEDLNKFDEKNNTRSNSKEQIDSSFEITDKKQFVNNILNSNNNYIESLLKLFSSKFRSIKKAIIKLFQILILYYGDVLENYFLNIEKSIKNGKSIQKVNKKEFYYFLEENISFTYLIKTIPNTEFGLIKNQIEIAKNENFKLKRNKSYKFNKRYFNENNNEINIILNKIRTNSTNNKKKNKNLIISEKKSLEDENKDNNNNIINKKEENVEIYHYNFQDDKIKLIKERNNLEKNIEESKNIAKIIIDFLIKYNSPVKSFISSDNSISLKKSGSIKNIVEKLTKNKNINKENDFVGEKIINLLVKFLSNTKELETINYILFLILKVKSEDTLIFEHLLDYFSYTKTSFLQLIEEILIISYLCLNDNEYKNKNIFLFIKNCSKSSDEKDENDYFNNILRKGHDLLISLYFHKNNKNKNGILNGIINLILLISKNNKIIKSNNNENKVYDLLLKKYEEFLEQISITFFHEISAIKMDESKKNEEKSFSLKRASSKEITIDNYYPLYYIQIKSFCEFIPFIFEFYWLKNNFLPQLDEYYNNKINIDVGFPEFYNIKNLEKYSVYYIFVRSIYNLFNIKKNFEKIENPNSNNNNLNKESSEINIFEKDFLFKIINEYLFRPEYKSEIKFKKELLLIKSDNLEKDYFIMAEIITILNNYYIEKYISMEQTPESDNTNFNIAFFLNFHQFFILNLILISCIIKENEVASYLNKNYKEIQDIFFTALVYNINNIIKNIDSNSNKYSEYFIKIFINIFCVISKIYEMYGEKGGKINFNKICLKKLLEFYMSKYKPLFNSQNLIQCSKNSPEDNLKLIEEHKIKMMEQILSRNPNENPIINIFDPEKFIILYKLRMEKTSNIILLMNQKNNNIESNNFLAYRSLYNRIKSLVIPYEYKMTLSESLMSVKKRNNYRKMKKKLYSWNNSYSNLDIFYKNNSEKLKFKISNFLSKDLSRKLLVPILDFDFYVPKFKTFDFKKKLFKKSEDNNGQNQYDLLYNIDLKIFHDIPEINIPPMNTPNFFIEEVCYIKTNHHINGVLFFSKNNSSKIFFSCKNPKPKEELLNNSNYDSEHSRCFGSIFSGEFNPKEHEMYFGLSFYNINFIFIRKYCFRNNSFEIFTINHRSYYFKFQDDKKRNQFLENLIKQSNKQSNIKKNSSTQFKPIKGIDENNKSIIIGYYRDTEENKPYSSISNITDLWKSNKISTFEYLMWINIYGNRSYQDVSQYPVFPWLLTNFESDKFEKLISDSNNIRDLRLPLGLINLDEKGKYRQNGYIESYKIMIMDLIDKNFLKMKMKDDDIEEETNNIEKALPPKQKDNNDDYDSIYFSSKKSNSIVLINNQNLFPKCEDKMTSEKPKKYFDYNLNLDNLYYNTNIPYEMLPYLFGSHFSNAMYTSHYLCRLFPYAFTAIEIQGIGFDCPDRLFINLQNSISSSISEKGDLREIIPDFFSLPEMFININKLELGKSNDKQIDNVKMPNWCLDNPYFFIENYRSLLECGYLNINSWIDLIFGYYQRGKIAQSIGNIYLPCVYDGVMNFRIKPEDLIKNRFENEFKIRFSEMGIHPTKVFEKKCKSVKNKINDQITLQSFTLFDTSEIFRKIKLQSKFKDIIYFNKRNSTTKEIYIIDKRFIEQKLIIQKNKEISSYSYSIKELIAKSPFPFAKLVQRNIEYKLIVKQIFQEEIYIITGLFDGELYVLKNTNKVECIDEKYKYSFDVINRIFDKSVITSLSIDKDEKFIIYGTQKGSLVIYTLNYNNYKETKKDFIKLHKFFPSHPGYAINYICINSILNLFADCAYDGYVNIYNLPICNLVRSIYIEPNTIKEIFNLDFVFMSAQPLPAIVVYSNEVNNFKCFSLNGNELSTIKDAEQMDLGINENDGKINTSGMISPIMFTDSKFNDYLIYILNNKYVMINKFPTMQIIGYIYPLLNNYSYITNLCLSNDLRYIYIYDEFNNEISIFHHNITKYNN